MYGACAPGGFQAGIFRLGRNQGATSAFVISGPSPQGSPRSRTERQAHSCLIVSFELHTPRWR